MKKNINIRVLLIFLSLSFFFLSFPNEAKAAFTECYQDGRYIGDLSARHLRSASWIVSNTTNQAYLEFYPSEISSQIYSDEVYMKQGNDPWIKITRGGGSSFEKWFSVGNERCGYVWVSVRWKSRVNEQYYYCNLKVTKYDEGPLIENFINQTCIHSTCRITNPLSKGAALTPYVVFPANGVSCNNYSLVFGSYRFMFGYNSQDDTCSTGQYTYFEAINGIGEAYVSPSPSTGFTTATGDLQLYNYINETSCGGVVTPTPTPVVKNICFKVTGYVKNKLTGKGVQGAKVTAHGIDNSVGNCQGKHYACGTATTNTNGYFEISCANVTDANIKCLGVYETNKTGFSDDYGAYGPAGSAVWNNNTIVLNNPQTNTCGPFYFFDKIGNPPTPTPTPRPVCARRGSSASAGQCNANCQAYCSSGYHSCNRSLTGNYCVIPDMVCGWLSWNNVFNATSGTCCCAD